MPSPDGMPGPLRTLPGGEGCRRRQSRPGGVTTPWKDGRSPALRGLAQGDGGLEGQLSPSSAPFAATARPSQCGLRGGPLCRRRTASRGLRGPSREGRAAVAGRQSRPEGGFDLGGEPRCSPGRWTVSDAACLCRPGRGATPASAGRQSGTTGGEESRTRT